MHHEERAIGLRMRKGNVIKEGRRVLQDIRGTFMETNFKKGSGVVSRSYNRVGRLRYNWQGNASTKQLQVDRSSHFNGGASML